MSVLNWETGLEKDGGIRGVRSPVLNFRTRYFYVLAAMCKRKVSQNMLKSRLGTA